MHRSYVRSGTCFNYVEVTSGSYFARSCIFVNSKSILKLLSEKRRTVCLLDGNSKDGRPLMDNGYSDRGYHMAKRLHLSMPLFALPLAHSHWKSLVQWPHQWACHKRLRECHLSVDTSWKAHGVLDPCACSNHRDHAICEIAVVLLQPDPCTVPVLCICMYVLCNILWPEVMLLLSHILITVMYMQLLRPRSTRALAS